MATYTKHIQILVLVWLLAITNSWAQTTEVWDPVETGTQKNLFEIKVLDSALAIPGDSGLLLFRQPESQNWQSIQLPGYSPVVSVETIAFQGNNSRHMVLQANGKVHRILSPSWVPVPDTLPAMPGSGLVCKKLLHLNLSGGNEIRYGIVCDSGRILGYKFPWSNPRFDIQLSTKKEVHDLFPFNTWNLLAIGDSGKIWKTVGLADPFSPVAQNLTSVRLNKVFKGQGNQLWIAADSGRLLLSNNLGNSWSLRQLPTPSGLLSGCAEDTLLWVCGDQGEIWKSGDQGMTWEQIPSGLNAKLKDIRNLNGQVWIVGEKGTLLKLRRVSGISKSGMEKVQTEFNSGLLHWNNSGKEPMHILLSDPLGRTVFHFELDPKQEISVPAPGKGLWMVHFRTGQQHFTEKWHFSGD